MSSHLTTATRVFLITFVSICAASSQAADGTIRIRGAVVEPACTVSSSPFGIDQDALQQASRERSSSAMPLELSMRCNAQQAIELRLLQPTDKIRAGFETGIDGVRMLMQHEGRAITPGEAVSISLPQRASHQIRMETRLEAEASHAAMPDVIPGASQVQDSGRMLVAIDYL